MIQIFFHSRYMFLPLVYLHSSQTSSGAVEAVCRLVHGGADSNRSVVTEVGLGIFSLNGIVDSEDQATDPCKPESVSHGDPIHQVTTNSFSHISSLPLPSVLYKNVMSFPYSPLVVYRNKFHSTHLFPLFLY